MVVFRCGTAGGVPGPVLERGGFVPGSSGSQRGFKNKNTNSTLQYIGNIFGGAWHC